MTEEDNKLIEAAKIIHEYCSKHLYRTPCCFSTTGICNSSQTCMLGYMKNYITPSDWKIPKMRRWTDADISLAKALVEFGVQKVKENHGEVLFVYESLCVKAPEGAFSALNSDETIYLKDIIAEGENNG